MEKQPDPFGWKLPFSTNLRIKLFLTGILFPAFNVAAGLSGTPATVTEPWQSGNLEPYVVLFLQAPGLYCFLPLIVFSALALGAIVWRPKNVRHLWVRLGLYSGGILSLQYIVAVALTSYFTSFLAAAIVGPCLGLLVFTTSEIVKKFHRFTILHLLIATAVVAVFAAVATKIVQAGHPEGLWGLIFVPLLAIFIAAPTLNFVTYLRMATFAATHEQTERRTIPLVGSLLVCLAGHGTAWRFSIIRVLDEYQNLPTTNPNCFVASAAAHGDPRLVKSDFVANSKGSYILNRQMQRLKFLELAFQSFFPRCHRIARLIYDQIGPVIARCCEASKWTANLTYLSLKPVELTAEVVRVATGISRKQVNRLYRNNAQE